jgi:hypothetical protein
MSELAQIHVAKIKDLEAGMEAEGLHLGIKPIKMLSCATQQPELKHTMLTFCSKTSLSSKDMHATATDIPV